MDATSLQKALEDLDLSKQDAEVYVSLITHQPCTSGPLINDTGLHRNVVYTSLAHLKDKKLIMESVESGKKLFQITNPKVLEATFEEKMRLAKTVVEKVSAMTHDTRQEITIHQGNKEFLALLTSLIESMPKKSTKYVIGTGGEDFMEATMLPIWKKYHKVAYAILKDIKMIAYADQRKGMESILEKEDIYAVRYLQEGSENPAGIHVYPEINTVLNIIYSREGKPVTAIKIVDKDLVQGYLQLFANLWEIAKA